MRLIAPSLLIFLAACLLTPASAKTSGASNSVSQKYILYVGAYGKGIMAYRFDTSSGKLEPLGLAGEIVNPSFLTAGPSQRFLYAVSEVEGKHNGGVGAFSIDPHSGTLTELNTRDSAGIAPCHLAVDHTGKMLIVANYTSGGVSSFPIEENGSLGERSSLMTPEGHGPNPHRQEGPHAHEVVIGEHNEIAYVPDLGLDHIRLYRIDPAKATLTENDPPFVQQSPGYGPRHMAFAPNGRFAYVVNELKSYVSVFQRDGSNGSMTKVQDVSTLPEGYTGENGPAEILIDSQGKFVYATNRGNDTIAVFAVEAATGKLHQIQIISAEGKMPRGLALDPSEHFMFAGNQKTNNFVIFHVDPQSGRLTPTGTVVNTPSPVAFLFVPAK